MAFQHKSLAIVLFFQSIAELWWFHPVPLSDLFFFGIGGIGQPVSEFGLENIDLNASAPCGNHKCFFLSNENPDVGFLVVRTDPNRDEDMQEQWNANSYLEKVYKRRNFLLAPPSEFSISHKFASQLNSLSSQSDRYSGNHTVLVQTVQKAPEPSIQLGCHEDRQRGMLNSMVEFIEYSVEDGELFTFQLKEALVSAVEVMEEEPWYARDWQAMMSEDGTLIDIDVAHIDPNNTIDLDGLNHLDWIDQCCDVFDSIYTQAVESSTKDLAFWELEEPLCTTKLHSLRSDDLDTSNLVFCEENSGGCLYQAAKNPHVGYLVANSTKSRAVQQANGKVASWIHKEFKIHHNVLGPPEELRKHLSGPNARDHSATIQKVKRFPSRTIRFTCRHALAEKPMFGGATKSFPGYIKDHKKFKNKVKQEVKKIMGMTQALNQSLVPNFRTVINEKGFVFLLDVHRVLKKTREVDSRSQDCLQAIVDWAKEANNFVK